MNDKKDEMLDTLCQLKIIIVYLIKLFIIGVFSMFLVGFFILICGGIYFELIKLLS